MCSPPLPVPASPHVPPSPYPPAPQILFRRIFQGVGIELSLPVHSPVLQSVELVRSGRVRRAKLYYLRELIGKAAKLKEIVEVGGGRRGSGSGGKLVFCVCGGAKALVLVLQPPNGATAACSDRVLLAWEWCMLRLAPHARERAMCGGCAWSKVHALLQL